MSCGQERTLLLLVYMTQDDLEQIRKIIREETVNKEELKISLKASEERVKTELGAEIKATEKRLKTELGAEIKATEKNLKQAILDSQKDTIKVFSDLLHTGFNMHEERISRIEDHLSLPHTKGN